MANEPFQVSTCNVGRGLYTLRYVDSTDGPDAAPAAVSPAQGYERIITLMSAPGFPTGRLERPGAVLVVVSSAPALLEIAIDTAGRSRTPHAQFSLELLSQGRNNINVVDASNDQSNESSFVLDRGLVKDNRREPVGSSGLEVVGHVARFGDVVANPGEWIAGPTAPSPIEGLSVRSLTDGIMIEAQYVNTLRPERWTGWQSAESIGTRQQASPLLGVKLRLRGERAAACELFVESLFLGSPVVTSRGQDVTIASASGVDPLIGLRLELREIRRDLSKDLAQSSRSRVRVFRSSEQST